MDFNFLVFPKPAFIESNYLREKFYCRLLFLKKDDTEKKRILRSHLKSGSVLSASRKRLQSEENHRATRDSEFSHGNQVTREPLVLTRPAASFAAGMRCHTVAAEDVPEEEGQSKHSVRSLCSLVRLPTSESKRRVFVGGQEDLKNKMRNLEGYKNHIKVNSKIQLKSSLDMKFNILLAGSAVNPQRQTAVGGTGSAGVLKTTASAVNLHQPTVKAPAPYMPLAHDADYGFLKSIHDPCLPSPDDQPMAIPSETKEDLFQGSSKAGLTRRSLISLREKFSQGEGSEQKATDEQSDHDDIIDNKIKRYCDAKIKAVKIPKALLKDKVHQNAPEPNIKVNLPGFREALTNRNRIQSNMNEYESVPCLKIKPAYPSEAVIVYFHANGEDIEQIQDVLEVLSNETNCWVVALEYPGYSVYKGGKSDLPIEEEILRDACKLIDHLVVNCKVNLKSIVLMGRSLGTGVASAVAVKYPSIAALILVSPFTSIKGIAGHHFGVLGKFLVRDRFNNLENVKHVVSNILLIHGLLDDVVPVSHSSELKNNSTKSKKCDLVVVKKMTHAIMNYRTDVAAHVSRFLHNISFRRLNFANPINIE